MPMPSTVGPTEQPSVDALAGLLRPEAPDPGAGGRLRMVPTPPFLLRHHPTRWEAESEGLPGATWLPGIDILPIVPGTHLMRTRKAGEEPSETYREALNADANNGWVHLDPSMPIPAECLPAGVPVGGYRRPVPCQDPVKGTPGVRHLEAWDVPRQWVPGSGPQKTKHDRGAYNRWRLWLVTSGIIAPPTDDVIEAIQQARGGRVERILARNPAEDIRAKKKADEETALLARMAEATVPEVAPEAPTPKRTGRKGQVTV